MTIMQYLFFFSLLSSFSQIPIVQSRCNHQAELSAILQFRDDFKVNCTNSYDGPNLGYPKTSSWDDVESLINGIAEWDGVECDPVSGHVIGLDLSSSCLHGSINTTGLFSHLVHLEYLNLAFNDFQGSSIPSELGNLSRLTYLNLSSSSFVGRVPFEISKFSMLTSLDLSDNVNLELNLKSLVRNMTNLEELDLSWTNLIPREVPKLLFTDMSSLRFLKLDTCELNGEFPQGIFHLPKLQHLSIIGNSELEGHLPTNFNSSTTPVLESLLLGWTSFSGTVPVSIGNFVLLRELDLYDCKFSGHIPASLGNLTRLIRLDLSYFNTSYPSNNFTSFSFWLGRLTNLRYLHIAGANLIGEISPSYLANLTHLSSLDLSKNILTGQIPTVLTKLTQLSYLELLDNQFTGVIPPGFVNLTKLTYLDVSNNTLSGPLPIQNMRNLEYISVSDNQLSGTLELDMFGEFTNLTHLVLSFNNLTLLLPRKNVSTGSILKRMVVLGLSSCRLSEFPKFLMHQPELQFLDLSYNNIEGQIPSWLGSINSLLVYVDMSQNFITGLDDPHMFLRWPNLVNLDISFNKLRGSLPVPSPSTLTYRASNNELTGEISHLICNLTSLQVLDFSTNHLSGELDPYCFSKSDLRIMNLRNNSFSGNIPEFCANGTNFGLMMIDLDNNQFQGKIPRSLANCARLEFFDAGSNYINDTFPSWLGSLSKLKVFILKNNALHGSIGAMPNMRSEYWFPELTIIDLSQNMLSGHLTTWHFEQLIAMKTVEIRNPSYLGQDMSGYVYGGAFYEYSLTMYNKGTKIEYSKILDALVAIDLSSNEFEGEIPRNIGDLQGLRLLNLSNNHLFGTIPSSLGDLTKLESLDLSSNKLFGQLPQQLTRLNFLSTFDVSHNNLTGAIPQGRQFDTFSNISYFDNPELCGEPLSRKCGSPVQEAPQPSENIARKEDNFWEDLNAKILWMIVLIGFGGGLVVGVAVENIVDWRILIRSLRIRVKLRN